MQKNKIKLKLFNLYIKKFLQWLSELTTETSGSIDFYTSKFMKSQIWRHLYI